MKPRLRVLSAVPAVAMVVGGVLGAVASSPPVAAAASPSTSAPSWKIQTTLNSTGFSSNEFESVSCATATSCVAVGSSGSVDVPFAEVWNGTSWALKTPKNPGAADGSSLTGVSCVASNDCTAVGSSFTDDGVAVLIEQWNGTAWSTTPGSSITLPSGTISAGLSGVDCISKSFCLAVGDYTSSSFPFTLAEVWNGSHWSASAPKNPGTKTNQLTGVSCTSNTTCVAVGNSTDGAGTESAIGEAYHSGAWTAATVPEPDHATSGALTSVSCVAGDSCFADGNYEVSVDTALAEHWNGTAWSQEVVHFPTGTDESLLEGVSCKSPTSCEAVGTYSTGGNALSLAEVWGGSSWSAQSTPNPSATGGDNGFLNSVSCTTTTTCTAVGDYQSGTSKPSLAERYAAPPPPPPPPPRWTLQDAAVPKSAEFSSLTGVACPASNFCLAVGYDGIEVGNGGDEEDSPFSETWNGRSWTTVSSTPTVKGADFTELLGVSCTASNFCVAVGWAEPTNGEGDVPVWDEWSGSSWTNVVVPAATGLTFPRLNGVSCTSTTLCLAVGTAENANDDDIALVLTWKGGRSFSSAALGLPSGASEAELGSVSCKVGVPCTAVGFSRSDQTFDDSTLAEVQHGNGWEVEATPNNSSFPDNELVSASCVSSVVCQAVGESIEPRDDPALAEGWAGRAPWSNETIGLPTGNLASFFDGVSCPATGACIAVGSYENNSDDDKTLADGQDGATWKLQDTANPTGSEIELKSVSCSSVNVCTAVGFYINGADVEVPLAERYQSTAAPPPPPATVGYWVAGADGSVYVFGTSQSYGDLPERKVRISNVVGMAVTQDKKGYWLVSATGGIFAFGDAKFYGSMGSKHLNKPIVGMAATTNGKGYWLVASDGGIFSFGDAKFYGSMGAKHLNKPIVGMAATPTGRGYRFVASDGGIFSFGDAKFYGSTGAIHLNKPIVGMATLPSGLGYWLVASDGGIFAFGRSKFYGSTGAIRLNKPIAAMACTPSGSGYWFTGSDGGIFSYGNAPYLGSVPGLGANVSDVVAVAGG